MKKHIKTYVNDKRISTQQLLQEVYHDMEQGVTEFSIDASGQHDIGGPLWDKEGKHLKFVVRNPGQRVGSMGIPGTEIIVEGSAPADVGWLNAGAHITVKGDGGDTSGHCAADGIIYIGGRAGTRTGSLMKHDPAYPPPQLWILKNTGSFSFEFMGGGIAVVCGYHCEEFDSVLGDRPCIGMVGGIVFVRGSVYNLPDNVKLIDELADEEWEFITSGMPGFLKAIDRKDLSGLLTVREEWSKIVPDKYQKTKNKHRREQIQEFRQNRWITDGLFSDVVRDSGVISSLVPTGDYRAYSPEWQNAVFAAPCEYNCPIGIPTQQRMNLLRKGKMQEALELVLEYTPFPGSVCGVACPNPCMKNCTRKSIDYAVLAGPLGKLSVDLPAPVAALLTGKSFAIVGSGVGGLSAAWVLALKGHAVTVFESRSTIGGKMFNAIPHDRLEKEIVQSEIRRILSLGVKVECGVNVTREKFDEIYRNFDGVVIATGAHVPRTLNFPGSSHAISALELLTSVNRGTPMVDMNGKSVVVIGAGDVGMDVCATAWKLGAKSVTAVDIQKPASSDKELNAAIQRGTRIIYPVFAQAYKNGYLHFKDDGAGPGPGPLQADLLVMAIGEIPDTSYLPENLPSVKGRWIQVDEYGRTADPKIYATGDVVKPGLLAEAIGMGRTAALAMHATVMNKPFEMVKKLLVPPDYLELVYFASHQDYPADPLNEFSRCISCGTCRDCGICVQVCGQKAINRTGYPDETFIYAKDEALCIGCGFCAAACPCGIWGMVPNLMGGLERE